MDLPTILPSSMPRIPQSVARQSCGEPTRNPLFLSVQATPTRRPDSGMVQRENRRLGSGVLEHGRCLPSSPLQPRRSSAQLFNAIPEPNVRRLPGSMMYTGIQDTPVKKRQDSILVHSHPDTPLPFCDQENLDSAGGDVNDRSNVPSKSNGESIYKSLGWDNVDDIDDLA
jgi:DNA replication regulator SLD3